jgi:hypothetical protein
MARICSNCFNSAECDCSKHFPLLPTVVQCIGVLTGYPFEFGIKSNVLNVYKIVSKQNKKYIYVSIWRDCIEITNSKKEPVCNIVHQVTQLLKIIRILLL